MAMRGRGRKLIAALAMTCVVGSTNSASAQDGPRLEVVGAKACEGVGKVSKVYEPKHDGRFIVVFEENHGIRAGRIEVALMISRLHNQQGLRDIGLEGFVRDQPFDTEWFRKLPDVPDKTEVATQLLKEGEINSVEFAALVYPDLKVFPIDDARYYRKVDVTFAMEIAPLNYLIAIARVTVSDKSEIEHITRQIKRAEGKKPTSADPFELLLNANPWTRERYNQLVHHSQDLDIASEVNFYREIERKAIETGAVKLLDVKTRQNMATKIRYTEGAGNRSASMVRTTLEVARKVNGPVAMLIGAGHTKQVCEKLEAAQQPYLLLTPNSLRGTGRFSMLERNAYQRKVGGLTVSEGPLGEALNKRENPKPVVSERFFQAKTELYLITAKLGGAGGGSGTPPPNGTIPAGMDPGDLNGRYIRVDPNTIEYLRNGEKIFMATINPDDPLRNATIWVRVSPGLGTGAPRGVSRDKRLFQKPGEVSVFQGFSRPGPIFETVSKTVDDYLKAALQEVLGEAKRAEARDERVASARARVAAAAKEAEDEESLFKGKQQRVVDALKELEAQAEKVKEADAQQGEKEAREAAEAAKKRAEAAEKKAEEAAEAAKKRAEAAEKKAEEEAKKADAEKKKADAEAQAKQETKSTEEAESPEVRVTPAMIARFASSREQALAFPTRSL